VSTNGAAISQPRASPWVSGLKSVPSPNGAAQSPRRMTTHGFPCARAAGLSRPFRACDSVGLRTQGVALGWLVNGPSALASERSTPPSIRPGCVKRNGRFVAPFGK
jgi:hypothetical protein